MYINEVTKEEYATICPKTQYFYNSSAFHSLNEEKAEKIYYFLFHENKRKLMLAGGVVGDEFKVPYSAPYGIFEKLQDYIRIEEIDDSLIQLEKNLKGKGINKITFRLPPHVCDESFISKVENSMIRCGYTLQYMDMNYHFVLRDLESYKDSLHRNARKNLKRSLAERYEFVICNSIDNFKRVYEVIKINRKRRNHPLRMTFEQVMDTTRLTEADFFLLKYDGIDVASAIVFKVNNFCYQVIYWGDIAGYENKRPMNLLAYLLYSYYNEKKIKLLDIGISTEDGIPNRGLCEYKESIGCEICMKNTYYKSI